MDKLYYWSGSSDKPPGSGTNEFLTNPDDYAELQSIKDWRKKLSNFWVAPFEADGRHWNSVEHMFQGTKLNIADPEIGYTFCIESNTPLSKADGSVAQSKRKTLTLSATELWHGAPRVRPSHSVSLEMVREELYLE
jgi:hypothetical protein